MKLQSWKNNISGLSLVEMLVALLVLAIIIVPLISMFTDGFLGIARTGRKSQDLYQAQIKVEAAIYTGANSITPSQPPLIINFADDSSVLVPGAIYEIKVNDIAITTFILNRRN